MSKSDEELEEERRLRRERRKRRLLPYFGKEKRKSKIVREADVLEIYIPPLKEATDRPSTSPTPVITPSPGMGFDSIPKL